MRKSTLWFGILALAGIVALVVWWRGGMGESAGSGEPPTSTTLLRETLRFEPNSAPTAGSPDLTQQAGGATSDPQRRSAIQLNRRALQELAADRPAEAVVLLREASLLLPDDAVMRLNLSRALGRWAMRETGVGHHQKALELLAEAADVDPDQGIPAFRTARVYLRNGRRVDARRILQQALADFPAQPSLLRISADLAVLEGDMDLAVIQIEEAERLQPEDQELQDRADQLRDEQELFRTFLTDATAHFESRYDPRDPAMVAWIPDLQRDLEQAWSDVVSLLGIQPQQRILVMWLDPERYRWRAPDWSSGLYDGRVRIMVEDYPSRQADIRRVLRHELTHAVLHTLGTRVPTWLHEGMAQIAEGREVELARELLRASLPLHLKVADLDSNWTSWKDRERVSQAYFYSMSLCGWLQEEFGEGVLRNLFHNLRGRTMEEGWARTFGLDFATVEAKHRAGWKIP